MSADIDPTMQDKLNALESYLSSTPHKTCNTGGIRAILKDRKGIKSYTITLLDVNDSLTELYLVVSPLMPPYENTKTRDKSLSFATDNQKAIDWMEAHIAQQREAAPSSGRA